ncbi:hypothetical protein Q1695_009197 [Nippostrongylus brasiliensis]|nr:hypothetical protein Q1695_009197 [Nippostrongylus brasiliensis]
MKLNGCVAITVLLVLPVSALLHDEYDEATGLNGNFSNQGKPEFLTLANDNQRKEYIELETNVNIPMGELRRAQDAWATKIGEPVLSAYKKHVATQDAARETENARMDKAVEKLSKAARKADSVIRGIYSNQSLTRKEINGRVSEMMAELPRNVYNELTLAIQ